MLPLWEEVLWPFLDAWDSVRLRTTSTQWNVPETYGPCGEVFFFFLLEKEPMVPQGDESAGAQHPAAWPASSPFDAEEANLCARSARPSTPASGMVFWSPS